MLERIRSLREKGKKEKLDSFLILNPINIFYFTSYKPDLFSPLILPISGEPKLAVSPLEYKQAKEKAKVKVIKSKKRKGLLKKELKKYERVGFEEGYCVAKTYNELRERLVTSEELINKIRVVKTIEEVKKIKRAVEIAKVGLKAAKEHLRPGITERELAAEIEYRMKLEGSSGAPFPTIVASGERGWKWHPGASDKVIKRKKFVLVDLGATYKNYCSDLTRTFYLGKMSKKQKKIYDKVKEVSEEIPKFVKAGKKFKTINKKAKELFGEYKKHFVHKIGHGIGLEIHEPPVRGWTLKENMVMTLEPGLYIEGLGGIRIENDFLIKKGGVVEL